MGKVAVIGSGSWGTAYASILADAEQEVTIWARRHEVADAINADHRNGDYLPDLELSPSIRATTDPHEAVADAEVVVLAVPSQSLRENLTRWQLRIADAAPVVSLMKGIELGTAKRMSEVISAAGNIDADRIVVVSGPNLAKEIAQKQPAAAVVASSSPRMRAKVAEVSAAPYFRPYLGGDVVGTEIAGATKNVIALAVGMASGMGLGENTLASLITRGLAGVGDLVATCSSPLSRNRTFGYQLGQGMSFDEVVAVTKQTAEGVKSCMSILELARNADVEVPIVENVAAVVHEGRQPADVVEALMSRARKHERA